MEEKAFDFAAEVTKQLITLATGIITITLTFSDDIVGDSSHVNPLWILWSWIAFLISICFGILTLMALTGILGKSSDNSDSTYHQQKTDNNEQENENASRGQNRPVGQNKGIYSSNVTKLAAIQIILFFVAIVLSVIYGYKSLTYDSSDKTEKDIPMIINSTEYRFENGVNDTVEIKPYTIDKQKTYKCR